MRPITIPKWAWITGGVIAASLVVAVPVVLKIEEFTMEPEEVSFQPQLIDNPQVVISTNPEATANLETVKLQQGRVYFRVEIDKIPPKQYRGTCQLFDGVGALVAVGNSTLETASGKLQSWCSYDFSKDADRPGEWNFKFLLEGRQIIEKTFTVSP